EAERRGAAPAGGPPPLSVGGGVGQARGARLVSDLALVGVAAFAMNAGLSAYGAISSNFFVNDLHITPQALGGLESLREVPGFLTVAMAAVTVPVREYRLAEFLLPLMVLGLAALL